MKFAQIIFINITKHFNGTFFQKSIRDLSDNERYMSLNAKISIDPKISTT